MKGFTEIQGVLLCVLMGLAAVSFLQIHSGQIAALAASRKGIQAQQYAQSTADLLRNTSYDKLDDAAHTKQAIANGNGWMSEVSIGAETTVNEVPQRMATVKVYRNSTVTAPDYSLQVPLSSAGGGSSASIGFPDFSKPFTCTQYQSDDLRTTENSSWGPYTLTCPEDGFVMVYTSGGDDRAAFLSINGNRFTFEYSSDHAPSDCCFIPAKKGDEFILHARVYDHARNQFRNKSTPELRATSRKYALTFYPLRK